MKVLNAVLILVFSATLVYGQLTKDEIKEILVLQGNDNGEFLQEQTDDLYERYKSSSGFNSSTLVTALSYSALSGISKGSHESYSLNYKNSSWMPSFMKDWYDKRVSGDEIFGPSLTWHKVWRDVDYATDRMAYSSFKRYFNGNAYYATAAQFFVKQISSYMIKQKMRTGRFF